VRRAAYHASGFVFPPSRLGHFKPSKVRHVFRGTNAFMSKRLAGDPKDEREHFYVCESCGQAVDRRDFGQLGTGIAGAFDPRIRPSACVAAVRLPIRRLEGSGVAATEVYVMERTLSPAPASPSTAKLLSATPPNNQAPAGSTGQSKDGAYTTDAKRPIEDRCARDDTCPSAGAHLASAAQHVIASTSSRRRPRNGVANIPTKVYHCVGTRYDRKEWQVYN